MNGKRLAELRRAKGLTQKDLGEQLSIAKETISNYERNLVTPSDETKANIARFFNVSLDYLLDVLDKPDAINRNISSIPREFKSEWLTDLNVYANFLVYHYEFSEEEKEFISKWANLSKGKRQAFLKLIQED